MPYKTAFVANTILQRAKRDSILDVNALKLTKLLYIMNGYYLAVRNQPLLGEMFEVGTYGPFLSRIFKLGKEWGGDPIEDWISDIDPRSGELSYLAISPNNQDFHEVFNKVWEIYKHYNYVYLHDITSSPDSPWAKAKEENETYIDNNSIRQAFLKAVKPKEEPDNYAAFLGGLK